MAGPAPKAYKDLTATDLPAKLLPALPAIYISDFSATINFPTYVDAIFDFLHAESKKPKYRGVQAFVNSSTDLNDDWKAAILAIAAYLRDYFKGRLVAAPAVPVVAPAPAPAPVVAAGPAATPYKDLEMSDIPRDYLQRGLPDSYVIDLGTTVSFETFVSVVLGSLKDNAKKSDQYKLQTILADLPKDWKTAIGDLLTWLRKYKKTGAPPALPHLAPFTTVVPTPKPTLVPSLGGKVSMTAPKGGSVSSNYMALPAELTDPTAVYPRFTTLHGSEAPEDATTAFDAYTQGMVQSIEDEMTKGTSFEDAFKNVMISTLNLCFPVGWVLRWMIIFGALEDPATLTDDKIEELNGTYAEVQNRYPELMNKHICKKEEMGVVFEGIDKGKSYYDIVNELDEMIVIELPVYNPAPVVYDPDFLDTYNAEIRPPSPLFQEGLYGSPAISPEYEELLRKYEALKISASKPTIVYQASASEEFLKELGGNTLQFHDNLAEILLGRLHPYEIVISNQILDVAVDPSIHYNRMREVLIFDLNSRLMSTAVRYYVNNLAGLRDPYLPKPRTINVRHTILMSCHVGKPILQVHADLSTMVRNFAEERLKRTFGTLAEVEAEIRSSRPVELYDMGTFTPNKIATYDNLADLWNSMDTNILPDNTKKTLSKTTLITRINPLNTPVIELVNALVAKCFKLKTFPSHLAISANNALSLAVACDLQMSTDLKELLLTLCDVSAVQSAHKVVRVFGIQPDTKSPFTADLLTAAKIRSSGTAIPSSAFINEEVFKLIEKIVPGIDEIVAAQFLKTLATKTENLFTDPVVTLATSLELIGALAGKALAKYDPTKPDLVNDFITWALEGCFERHIVNLTERVNFYRTMLKIADIDKLLGAISTKKLSAMSGVEEIIDGTFAIPKVPIPNDPREFIKQNALIPALLLDSVKPTKGMIEIILRKSKLGSSMAEIVNVVTIPFLKKELGSKGPSANARDVVASALLKLLKIKTSLKRVRAAALDLISPTGLLPVEKLNTVVDGTIEARIAEGKVMSLLMPDTLGLSDANLHLIYSIDETQKHDINHSFKLASMVKRFEDMDKQLRKLTPNASIRSLYETVMGQRWFIDPVAYLTIDDMTLPQQLLVIFGCSTLARRKNGKLLQLVSESLKALGRVNSLSPKVEHLTEIIRKIEEHKVVTHKLSEPREEDTRKYTETSLVQCSPTWSAFVFEAYNIIASTREAATLGVYKDIRHSLTDVLEKLDTDNIALRIAEEQREHVSIVAVDQLLQFEILDFKSTGATTIEDHKTALSTTLATKTMQELINEHKSRRWTQLLNTHEVEVDEKDPLTGNPTGNKIKVVRPLCGNKLGASLESAMVPELVDVLRKYLYNLVRNAMFDKFNTKGVKVSQIKFVGSGGGKSEPILSRHAAVLRDVVLGEYAKYLMTVDGELKAMFADQKTAEATLKAATPAQRSILTTSLPPTFRDLIAGIDKVRNTEYAITTGGNYLQKIANQLNQVISETMASIDAVNIVDGIADFDWEGAKVIATDPDRANKVCLYLIQKINEEVAVIEKAPISDPDSVAADVRNMQISLVTKLDNIDITPLIDSRTVYADMLTAVPSGNMDDYFKVLPKAIQDLYLLESGVPMDVAAAKFDSEPAACDKHSPAKSSAKVEALDSIITVATITSTTATPSESSKRRVWNTPTIQKKFDGFDSLDN